MNEGQATGSKEPRRLGSFRILREIGRGGFGVVYEAIQEELNRRVALKVYHSSFAIGEKDRARFEREALIAASVEHTHVLPVYKIGDIEGVPYLAMLYVDGCSLAQALDELRSQPKAEIRRSTFLGAVAKVLGLRGGRLMSGVEEAADLNHAEAAAELVLQAAEALSGVHARGIIHRDLKPANLLLRRDGHLFVADFGLARDESLATLTCSGEFQGTPHYLSPEQILADRKAVDHRSDVYSLGATLYELLTLRPPHEGTTSTEIVKSIAFKRPISPRRLNSSVPRELSLVVEKAIERSPADRYQTTEELAADLRRFLAHEAVLASRVGPLGRTRRWVGRHKAATLASVAGAAALCLGGHDWIASLLELRGRRTGEIVRAQSRLQVLHAAAQEHIAADRLEEAAQNLAVARELGAPAHAHAELESALANKAQGALVASLEVLEGIPGTASAQAVLDAASRARRIVRILPAAQDPTGPSRIEAALAYADDLERALRTFPILAQVYSSDEVNAGEALGLVAASILSPPRLELEAEGGEGNWRFVEHRDFGVVRDATPDALLRGGVVFGGYAIQCEHPAYDDFRDVDARGKWVLCFRHCPGFESDQCPFGDQDARSALSMFAKKAEAAEKAGAIGLLVVDRPLEPDPEERLVRPQRTLQLPARTQPASLPILHVRARLAEKWVGMAGKRLAELRVSIDTTLKSLGFQIPKLEISLRDPRVVDGTDPACLLPILRRLVARDQPARRMAFCVATLLRDTDELIRDGLRQGSASDCSIIALRLTRAPRPPLEDALEELLARWHEEGGESRPKASLQDYLEHRSEHRRTVLWPENERPRFHDVPDRDVRWGSRAYYSVVGLVLAALWKTDPGAGLIAARRWVLRREPMAVHILLEERDSTLPTLLKQVLESDSPNGLDPRSEAERSSFTMYAARTLVALGDYSKSSFLVQSLRQQLHQSPIGIDVRLDVELLTQVLSGEGSPELLDVYLSPDCEELRPRVWNALRKQTRLELIGSRLTQMLDDERACVQVLGLIQACPEPLSLPTLLQEKVRTLLAHPDTQVADLAQGVFEPAKARFTLLRSLPQVFEMIAVQDASNWTDRMIDEVCARLDRGSTPDAAYVAHRANEVAWRWVRPENPEPGPLRVALALARLAERGSEGQDAQFLDTLAYALAANGELAAAVEAKRRALDLQPEGPDRAPFAATLERFQQQVASRPSRGK